LRGGSGPLSVEFAKTDDPIEDAMYAAAAALGYPRTPDYNSESVGFGRTQFNISKGRRHSAARAFLRGIRKRPNLTLLTHATARRVLLDGTKAYGIAYGHNGVITTAEAQREVILSGGSFNTPQLLMLSGIGPADHLREFGIDVVAALPVGDNLQDHLKGVLLWKRRPPRARCTAFCASIASRSRWRKRICSVRDPPRRCRSEFKRSSRRVPSSKFRISSSCCAPPRSRRNRISPACCPRIPMRSASIRLILHPESRGTVRLQSTDPLAPVRIHYNYLSAPADIAKFRQGFRLAREIGNQAALDAYRDVELVPGPDVTSDADIDAHLRRTSTTVSHPVSTCRMGTGENCVLDPDLRVRGIENLRVVDASAFPELVSAHTNAAVLMLAEKPPT